MAKGYGTRLFGRPKDTTCSGRADAERPDSSAEKNTTPPSAQAGDVSIGGQELDSPAKHTHGVVPAHDTRRLEETPLAQPVSASDDQGGINIRMGRPNDPGILRRPRQFDPEKVRAVTPEDREKVERERAKQEAPDELTVPSEFLGLPRWLTGTMAGAVLFGALGIVSLFVYAQALTTISHIAHFPVWAQWLAWFVLMVIVGAVFFAVVRFSWLYFRLRRVQQVRLPGFRETRHRSFLRRNCQSSQKRREAVDQLREFLERYDTQGLRPKLAASLTETQSMLLDPNRFGNYDKWLSEFCTQFQKQLDDAARERVHFHAMRVAWKTAVSPIALVDTIVTGYHCFMMLGDLCKLYNVRTNNIGAACLLSWVFFNAYVAGRFEELQEVAEERIGELFSEGGPFADAACENVANLAPIQVVKVVGGKLGPRAASGFLGYLLVRRLGGTAIRMLQAARPA